MSKEASGFIGFSLPGVELPAAHATAPVDGAKSGFQLQNGFDPLVEARLTDVVNRLRGAWLAHIAGIWGDIHTINVSASGDLEKRVATVLRQGFFHFSQLLCGLELLLLDRQKFGVVTEESVLGIEKLIVELGDDRSNLVEIPDCERGLPEFSRCGNRADRSGHN